MAATAIVTRLHQLPHQLSLRGLQPSSSPCVRFRSSPILLLRRYLPDRAIATPPPLMMMAPVVARAAAAADDGPLPDPDPRKGAIGGISALLFGGAVAAAMACGSQAALALSGGSVGGCGGGSCSSSSSSTSSSSSSSFSSSSWSSSKKKKKKKKKVEAEAEATHESVGTATEPPPEEVVELVALGATAFILACFVALALFRANMPRQTIDVVKLQVALRGPAAAKSFQKDLNDIAEKVQASNRRWYKFILTETTHSLRRHKYFCISSSLTVDAKDRDDSWREHFNKISLEERSKFDEETLSNLQGVMSKKTYSMKTDGSKNEYIVLTILAAVDGTLNLPKAMSSVEDLEAALTTLSSTPESDLRGVQIMWAPQDVDDVLSPERMHKDYPHLKPMSA